MKKSIILTAASAILICTAALAGPPVSLEARPGYVGVRLDLIALWRAKASPAPTRTVYVEEYRQTVYGPITAQSGAGEIDDTGGRVVSKGEVEEPRNRLQVVTDHFRRNAGRYVAGAIVAGVAAVGENNDWFRNKDGKDAPAQPTEHNQIRSPTVAVQSGDGSPVTVNITIQEMAAAE